MPGTGPVLSVATHCLVPWPVVDVIDAIAWRLGYLTYVRATAGPGWHGGRVGPEEIFFIRRMPGEARAKRLKPLRRGGQITEA